MTAASPKFEIRELSPNDDAALAVVGSLHMQLLGFGPMAGLGQRFVEQICYRMHMQERLLRTALAYVDGEPAGLVAYTPMSATFHRQGLGAHPLRIAIETLRAIATSPLRIPALLRGLKVLASRRGERRRIDDDTGEIVCIAVLPQFLSGRFVRASGIRVSEQLVEWGARYLRRAGSRHMRMLVDEDNKGVLLLYHSLGARFERSELGGAPTLEVWFDLASSRLTADCHPPALWLTSPAATVPDRSGWADYWESIGEGQRFFAAEAHDYAQRLRRSIGLGCSAKVLDFGCGFGWVAAEIAGDVARVDLWDGAASVRRRALVQTAHLANVRPIDLPASESDLRGSYDLVLVHSVVQYMTAAELRAWVDRWRALLAPGGSLVLSDLVQPHTSFLPELVRYLCFGLRSGFFLDLLISGLREFTRYFGTRSRAPLMTVAPEQIHELARGAGLSARTLEHNLSYRASRRTVLLRAS